MHLGYAERRTIRGEDSFVTFAEVFKIALEQKVDMVLLQATCSMTTSPLAGPCIAQWK